ncbi:MAG: S8 family serine peptidase, partial [Chloroflexota bacterium]|nr:S8 family serine peptidase [Chloroflexota bacterium]
NGHSDGAPIASNGHSDGAPIASNGHSDGAPIASNGHSDGTPIASNGHSDGAPIASNGHSDGTPVEPELLRALLEAGPGDSFRVILRLRGQTNLRAAAGGALNATESRARLVSALQATANRSQALLRPYLEGARAAGRVQSYTSFWIVNGIAVHADRDIVWALAERPEVSTIYLDHYRQWIVTKPLDQQISNQQIPNSPEWGIARIRADEVWASLNISGTGVVVAGMDTGVDWFHPALRANYRGYNPHGPANHAYSWYDATGDGALYPVDGHGHGSHTLGTIVGQEGIGVAPGARWVGVKVLNSQGYGYDSWIHAGFQWLLAPGGDPAQAPDVVNNSWGNKNGGLTTFQPDLQALRAAGIAAVFANGNEGPGGGTVGSPASLPEAFAVGATDSDDEVASFSSRGPSPWGEIRPHVAAPGVNVRSCLPGGAYGSMNGTSMAAPHVAGIAALLRSVSPTLSITRTLFLITSTVVPLGDPVPNNDTGWGRVDAFGAVVALAQSGLITGTVTQAGGGDAIAGATVAAAPHGGGSGGTTATDAGGRYLLALAPAIYDVT